ncbi:MAG: hypothetical protein AABZ14_01255, partial [Candidatus Margulisiibacteriota bacterium]
SNPCRYWLFLAFINSETLVSYLLGIKNHFDVIPIALITDTEPYAITVKIDNRNGKSWILLKHVDNEHHSVYYWQELQINQ